MKRSALTHWEIESLKMLIRHATQVIEDEDQQLTFMSGALSAVATVFGGEKIQEAVPEIMNSLRFEATKRQARQRKMDRRKSYTNTEDIGPNITRITAYEGLTKFNLN